MLKDWLVFELYREDAVVAIGSMMVHAHIHQEGGTIKPKEGKEALNVHRVGFQRSVTILARTYLGISTTGKASWKGKFLLG